MKNLFYFNDQMSLSHLYNIREEARLNCQTSTDKKKFIRFYESDESFFYGSEKELERYCQDYDLDKENFYKII